MNDQPIDFGPYLQSQRRAKGMALEAVARKTKISLSCLRQIESEDWDQLPSPIFVKGFVRAFAEAVDADVHDALARFAANHAMQVRVAQSQQPIEKPTGFWGRIALAALLLALLIGGTLYVTRQLERAAPPLASEDSATAEQALPSANENSQDVQAEDASVSPPAPTTSSAPPAIEAPLPGSPLSDTKKDQTVVIPAPSPAESPAVGTQMPAAPADPLPAQEAVVQPPPASTAALVLEITAVETTWVSVTQDERPAREMILRSGDTVTLKAETGYTLIIGNAGGVRLRLDDQPVSVPGRSGQVARLRLP